MQNTYSYHSPDAFDQPTNADISKDKDYIVRVVEVELRSTGPRSSLTLDPNTTAHSDEGQAKPHNPTLAQVRSLPNAHIPALGIRDSRLHGGEPGITQYLSRPTLALPVSVSPPREQILWKWRSSITTYKVLFTLVFLGNAVALIKTWASQTLSQSEALNAVSIDILFAVAIRQEELLNLLFSLISKMPPRTPLIVRKHLADVHHYGGLHTGCAVSSILWYIAYIVLSTQTFFQDKKASAVEIVDTVTCYLFVLLLLVICLPALPYFRAQFHNTFEKSHRFGGWLSIAVFWVHAFTTKSESESKSSSIPLWKNPSLYLLSAITGLLFLPWLRIRYIPISTTRLSDREMSITFDYNNMPFCSTMRFSTSPVWEWHPFATIPVQSTSTQQSTKASILVAESGDWTRKLISNPPKHLWIRGPPTYNFLQLAKIFSEKGILVIATGAGIGPVLSLLAEPEGKSSSATLLSSASTSSSTLSQILPTHHSSHRPKIIKILWCARTPHPFIAHTLRKVDPQALILDSKDGRFDIKTLARGVVAREGLEAAFVVSNKKITDFVVRGLNREGIPAYGATFDS